MFARTGWADRNGNNHASGMFPRNGFDRSHHRVACGKSIVDQNDLASFESRGWLAHRDTSEAVG